MLCLQVCPLKCQEDVFIEKKQLRKLLIELTMQSRSHSQANLQVNGICRVKLLIVVIYQ